MVRRVLCWLVRKRKYGFALSVWLAPRQPALPEGEPLRAEMYKLENTAGIREIPDSGGVMVKIGFMKFYDTASPFILPG